MGFCLTPLSQPKAQTTEDNNIPLAEILKKLEEERQLKEAIEEPLTKEPTQNKKRKVLKTRINENGVQGRWMPKKTWEPDTQYNVSKELKKKKKMKLSDEALGKNPVPKKTW